jgi:hypothetical protein
LLAALIAPTARGAVATPPEGRGDVETFQAVVSRLRDGEAYYPVFGEELRRGNYPTAQAFNWRTPFLFAGLSLVPERVARGAWLSLALVVCGLTILTTSRLQPAAIATAALLQVGAVAAMDPPAAVVMGEAWAGALIVLSVCAFGWRHPAAGIAFGLTALFVRELAAPYCVACTLAAIAARRWREVAAWLAGAGVYAAYYAWHLNQVWPQQLPTDAAHASSWLQFGGLTFLLIVVRFHRWLHVAPTPLAALGLALIVAGTANASTPFHVRLASAAYLVFFLSFGHAFNEYWGLIAWPTWALASGYGVHALLGMAAQGATPRDHGAGKQRSVDAGRA